MKSSVRVCYILSIAYSAILEIATLIFIVPTYASAIETLRKINAGSTLSYNPFYTYYYTIVRLILFTLFAIGLIIAFICSIHSLNKVQDESYYKSKKNGIYIASIILGIFSFPMLLAGLFALIDSDRNQ